MAQRRQSAPSIVIRGVLGRTMKSPSPFHSRDENIVPYSPNVNSQRLSLKFGSHGATLNLSKRKYVMEGKVQLTTGMQTQDRYMFLFTDLLLIAKAKSGSNFKLKYRIRVCELWIASCLDDVCELPKTADKSFVMGWPTTNCVATFSTPESKELWLSALTKKIHEEKSKETPKRINLKIINRDSSNTSHIKMVSTSHKDTAKDVVRLAVKEYGFESEDDYQLWVMSRKEGTAYPLIGHENPHAILLSHIRDFISTNGILPETEITSVEKYENFIQPEIRDRCQFILRNTRQSPKYNADMAQKRVSRLKAKTPAIFNWARKRSGQRNESSDSGHVSGNSVGSEGTTFFSSSPPSTSPPATPKLFSLPLGQVCDNGELPSPIASMLDILYRKAPYTTGIFRKSANAKTTRHLKHKLDEETEIDFDEVSIHVIAALVKDFLRNIPDSVMDCTIYNKWTLAIENSNEDEKLKTVRRLLMSLDACNRVLIRRLAIVLNRIASRSERNQMTPYNLAVCIAPSLLWSPGPSIQTEAPIKVTEILQYFVVHCQDVFDNIAPTDVGWPPEIELKSDDDDDYEGDNEKSTGTIDGSVSPISDGPTTHKSGDRLDNEEKEDEESDVSHFNRSRMIRRQLQRRKPGSKADGTRLLSLSQDSLDRVLDEAALNSNQHAVDDMLLSGGELHHNRRMQQRGSHRGRDACSMSNDSGFTTLSGEEEESSSSYPGKRIPKDQTIHMSSSTGSNLNGLSVAMEEDIRIATEELKRLAGRWSPSLFKIGNGQIIEENELGGIKEEMHESAHNFDAGYRRQSQPVVPRCRHSVSVDSGGSRKVSQPIMGGGSRLVQAITSPTIEYDESDDDDEMTSPFMRQPPKYVRLNDRSDHDDYNSGLAKEYLRELRRQSTDDVTENIAKSMTSSENSNKKQYTTGVTVTVGDVRTPVVQQYRPVTLSIRGITEPDVSPTGFTSPKTGDSSTTSGRFFIGDGNSSGSTPDALSSSQEDVFKDWNASGMSRERSHTAPDIEPETPKTAPLSRKFNSARSRKMDLNLSLTPDSEIPHNEALSPIQKLTENLQMLPDFRRRSSRKSTSDESSNPFMGRKKASSVREARMSSKATIPAHYIKRTSPARNAQIGDAGTGKSKITTTGSRSSISDASKSSLESSSRTSLSEAPMSSPKDDTTFERDVRSRRPRRRYNLGSKMTKDASEGAFSKSLPATDWIDLKANTDTMVSQRESSRESIVSDSISCRSRLRDSERETDIVNELKPLNFSSGNAPSSEEIDISTTQAFQPRAGSVKSKITAYNHLISNGGSDTNSSNSPVEIVIRDGDEQELRVRRKNAVAVPPPKIDTPVRHQHHQVSGMRSQPSGKISEDSSRNGLVIRASPDASTRKSGPGGSNDSVSIQIHKPDDKFQAEKSNHRSPQPVSDNLLFTLSESFAFGNRKSPRNITPNGSPKNSPRLVRRRRGDSRTSHSSTTTTTPQDRPRLRNMSVDRYIGTNNNKTHNNLHVASISVKRNSDDGSTSELRHGKPTRFSQSISQRDKNSNELFPFIGLDKVIHSEESYV